MNPFTEGHPQRGGVEAVQLRVAEKYVEQLRHIARTTNTVVLPAMLSDVGSMVALARLSRWTRSSAMLRGSW